MWTSSDSYTQKPCGDKSKTLQVWEGLQQFDRYPCISKDLSDRVGATPHLLFEMDISQAHGGSISNERSMPISRLKLFLRIGAAMAELPPHHLKSPTISMAPQSLPMTHMVTPRHGKTLPKLCFDIFKAVTFTLQPPYLHFRLQFCGYGCVFM